MNYLVLRQCLSDSTHQEYIVDDDNSSVSGSKHETFLDCLAILFNNEYKLIDAYPTLCRVYAIAIAIPVTSATAEYIETDQVNVAFFNVIESYRRFDADVHCEETFDEHRQGTCNQHLWTTFPAADWCSFVNMHLFA